MIIQFKFAKAFGWTPSQTMSLTPYHLEAFEVLLKEKAKLDKLAKLARKKGNK